jgi:hypothetical protein
MRSILGVLPETKHFGSFVCISDSPNGGKKVKNQALTSLFHQTSKKFQINFVKNLNVLQALYWSFLKMP